MNLGNNCFVPFSLEKRRLNHIRRCAKGGGRCLRKRCEYHSLEKMRWWYPFFLTLCHAPRSSFESFVATLIAPRTKAKLKTDWTMMPKWRREKCGWRYITNVSNRTTGSCENGNTDGEGSELMFRNFGKKLQIRWTEGRIRSFSYKNP